MSHSFDKKYLTEQLSIESLRNIYRVNSIDIELAIVYRDFTLTLCDTLYTTYLGDDIMTDQYRKEHFDWSWSKTKDIFSGEGFYFTNTEEIEDYFYQFMLDVYYGNSNKENFNNIDNKLNELWVYLFNLNITKSKSDVDTFIQLYKMFNKSLIK